MSSLLVTLFTLLYTVQLPQQEPDPARIKEGTEQYIIYNQNGSKKTIIAYLARRIERQNRGGKAVIVSTQRYDRPNGTVDTDTTIMDAASLFPLTYRALVGEQREAFEFVNGRVKGTIHVKDTLKKSIDAEVGRNVYCSVPELDFFYTLPLNKTFKGKYHFINPSFPVTSADIEVVGEEEITIGGKSLMCWVIEKRLNGKGSKPRYWITKDTQTTLKMSFPLPNGATFWKVRLVD